MLSVGDVETAGSAPTTPLFAGERAELIPDGKPVAGTVTHLRYRVLKPPRPAEGPAVSSG